jgi:valyl-tRNA synthetase
LWQLLSERKTGESIMISRMPEAKRFNKELISEFEKIKETVTAIRTVRKTREIPNKESMELMILADAGSYNISLFPVVSKLCNLTEISFVSEKKKGSASFMIGTTEYFIPLQGKIDTAAEIAKLKEDLGYNKGFLINVMKKLDNERFVKNAPANVLELERRKKNDAESKIKSIEERIKELKKLS